MNAADFLYRSNFPSLSDAVIYEAITSVSALFSGVLQLWQVLPKDLREQKRMLCLNLLVGWYLMDMHPQSARGVMGNGGMLVTGKSIAGTSFSFGDVEAQEGLKQLNSNVFGQKALMMIHSAPERYGIYA